ncbi:hypothetical protein AMTR_s00047p00082390 [Amborella trichopoda]|uniref:DUF659 domain-containing protein n=1 Tax=Amborella trichopoda TaxID=13333 RepID=U5CWM8_AMBTC|nr:hypothetical protein AMTR_s00047p00082390 [Amborella trichopoda]
MYPPASDVEEINLDLFRSTSIAGYGRIDRFLSKPKSQQMSLKGMVKGKLMDKMKHLVWTPCAAHIIDLMLEEIDAIKIAKETLEAARFMSRFTYNHSKI